MAMGKGKEKEEKTMMNTKKEMNKKLYCAPSTFD